MDDTSTSATPKSPRRVDPLLMMSFWLAVFFVTVAAAIIIGP